MHFQIYINIHFQIYKYICKKLSKDIYMTYALYILGDKKQMGIIKTFIMMLIGILLMPSLAAGINTVTSDANVTGTAAAAVVGAILTIYAILILYGGAKSIGAV